MTEEEPAASRVLVFCNTIESCRAVENGLRRRDRRGVRFQALPFHGAIPADSRKSILSEFTSPERSGAAPKVLVATDRASRGMDFPQVSHVVLFDFPRDGVEYVRRVGRATRGAHQPGRVTSLLLGRQVRYNPLAHAGHACEERRRALGCAWGGERLGPKPSRWPLEPVRFAPPGPAGKGRNPRANVRRATPLVRP